MSVSIKATVAKFTVGSITEWSYGGKTVNLVAVTDDKSPENKAFWEATPNGKIELAISNNEASKIFKPGKSYYVSFKEA